MTNKPIAKLDDIGGGKELARQIYTAWMKDERFPVRGPAYFWAELAARAALMAASSHEGEPQTNTATIAQIIREVSDLPDRTSPPEQPDLLQITVGELHEILTHHLAASSPEGMNGWLPIETAPKTGKMVLVCSAVREYWRMAVKGFDPHYGWKMAYDKPTHWRPLPDPPTAASSPEGSQHK